MRRTGIVTDDLPAVKFRWLFAGVLLGLLAWVDGAAGRNVPTQGQLDVLVVLAGFPDRPLAHDRGHFVGGPDALVDRLVAYYAEVSAGRLRIVPHVGTMVVTLPERRARYVQRPEALAGDALRAFATSATDADDRTALTRAQAAVVFFAGIGRESHTQGGDPGDPWSNFTAVEPAAAGFDEACVIAEDETPPLGSTGVLCHEFGHLLGLPELYAPGGRPQEGIGIWGLMGQGTWVGHGGHPTSLEAWSRMKLGWADVQVVDRDTTGLALPAAPESPQVVKVPLPGGPAEEYYLLENRRRAGVDERLPGEGLLVWHVDERLTGFRSAQNDASHKLLHLVEADGRGDLDRGHDAGGNRGDATDPWQGPPRWWRRAGTGLALGGAILLAGAVFRLARPRAAVPVAIRVVLAGGALYGAAVLQRGPECGPGTPGMAPYDGGSVPVAIRNISPAGPVMRFDVRFVKAAAQPTQPTQPMQR
jgi:immune inhibitor A